MPVYALADKDFPVQATSGVRVVKSSGFGPKNINIIGSKE
jgi:hypothetical protein